jgi:hypothetical protein
MYENVLPGMAQNAWNEGVTMAGRMAAGRPLDGTPILRDATPGVTEIYRNSLMPRVYPFEEPYVDPGHAKFLEIQKMEYDYRPPKQINHSVKSDFEWFNPAPHEPIIPKSSASALGLAVAHGIQLQKERENSNSYFKPKWETDFGVQPIKTEINLFPKRGGMHDSFNVNSSGDIFNGHTTIELKGGLKKHLPW